MKLLLEKAFKNSEPHELGWALGKSGDNQQSQCPCGPDATDIMESC